MERDPKHPDHGEVPWRAPATPRRRRRRQCSSPWVKSRGSVGPGGGGCRGGGNGELRRPVVRRSSRSSSPEEKGNGGSVFPLCRREREGGGGNGWVRSERQQRCPSMRSAAGQGARSRAARGGHAAEAACPRSDMHRVQFSELLNRGFSHAEPDSVTLATYNSQSRPI
jgi:hypothetical protein